MNLNLDQQGLISADTNSATPDRTSGSSYAQVQRLGPLDRGEETTPLHAVVLGMHRSGTSFLTSLLDRLGFYAGPDESLMPVNDYNPKGYWEHSELHALDEEMLAALGGSWTDVLEVDPRRLSESARARFLPRARALVRQLDSYGSWVIKDPRLCLLLPFWRGLLERPFCILIHRDPLAVARSLARRDGLPILAGIALWEHHNLAALSASQGLPRVLVGYRELVDDPATAASRLIQSLAARGVRGLERLRKISPADSLALLDRSLEHHAAVPGEHLGYLNTQQRELLHALESGNALSDPVPPLSAGAREILEEHTRQTRARAQSVMEREAAAREAGLAERIQRIESLLTARDTAVAALEHRLVRSESERRGLAAELQGKQEAVAALEQRMAHAERERGGLAAELRCKQEAVAALEQRLAHTAQERGGLATELRLKQQEVDEREALLAAVFASRSWRLGFGLKRLLGVTRQRRSLTAVERWRSLRQG